MSPLHETTSEIPKSMHEMKSEQAGWLHEITSEHSAALHEMKSEFAESFPFGLPGAPGGAPPGKLSDFRTRKILFGLGRRIW